MAQKSGDFPSMDLQQAMKLAQSDAAKQLFTLLQSSNSGTLQSAMEQAAAGNIQQTKALLAQLMADPKTKELVEKLREANNG